MNSYPEINRNILFFVRKYAISLYQSFNGAIDVEDFEQDLLLSLMTALPQFDVKKGYLLSFVNRCLFTKSTEIKRNLLRDKRKTFLYTTSLDNAPIGQKEDNFIHIFNELLEFLPASYRKLAKEIQQDAANQRKIDSADFFKMKKLLKAVFKFKGGLALKNISCIETLSIRELSKLNETDLHDLSVKIGETSKWIKSLIEKFEAALTIKYAEEAKNKINEGGTDFGSCSLQKGQYTVNVQMPKKVQWDQSILEDIYKRNIPEAQGLLKVSYNIFEKDYNKLSTAMLELLAPARSTSYGKIKITFEEGAANENN